MIRRVAAAVVVLVLAGAAPAHGQGSLDVEKLYLWSGGTQRCVGASTGSGAPSGGTTCDTYIDYSTGDLYTKHSGTWTKIPRLESFSIVGASLGDRLCSR